MILKLYTVYDVKTEAYLKPFEANAKGEAIRLFKKSVNTPDHPFQQYPEDFTLFEIGEWDNSNCAFNIKTNIVPLARAIEMVSDGMRQAKIVKEHFGTVNGPLVNGERCPSNVTMAEDEEPVHLSDHG